MLIDDHCDATRGSWSLNPPITTGHLRTITAKAQDAEIELVRVTAKRTLFMLFIKNFV